MLEECVSYLDACIYNMKSKKSMSSQDIQGKIGLSDRLKKQKYECKTHIQLCALLSQLGQHDSALIHGKTAVKKCEQFINDCHILCTDHLSRHKQKSLKTPQKKLLEKPHYSKFHELVTKAMPSIEYLLTKLRHKRIRSLKVPKLDMRSVLGVQRHNDWICTYNIGDMMLLQPLSLYELKNNTGVQAELTRDLMLEKILMTVVSHFCVATEIRFLANDNSKTQAQEGRLWHKKALEFGQPFLPSTCPLFMHITNSYMRNYSDGLLETSKGNEKRPKKAKNKTPNPEMKRPRSTSAPRTKQREERPSTGVGKKDSKKKVSPRVGDRTPPARTVTKETKFHFNSPPVEHVVASRPKILNHFNAKQPAVDARIMAKKPMHNSLESDADQEIVISSYDLYGIHSDENSEESETSQIDSTGGKLTQEPVIISATGGNSCLFKS